MIGEINDGSKFSNTRCSLYPFCVHTVTENVSNKADIEIQYGKGTITDHVARA